MDALNARAGFGKLTTALPPEGVRSAEGPLRNVFKVPAVAAGTSAGATSTTQMASAADRRAAADLT
jgi:hypothetical protein